MAEGQDGAFLTALMDEGTGVEAQSALLLQAAMTTEAAFLQDGSHFVDVIGCSGFRCETDGLAPNVGHPHQDQATELPCH